MWRGREAAPRRGGQIEPMKEVEELLAQGLSAVSASNPIMWIK
jgi:glycerol-3-phosphate responsive antiterminator